MKRFWTRIRRGLALEIRYFQRKFQVYKFLLLVFLLIQSIVISLGDVQAFFLSNRSLLPSNWTFFKNPTNAKITSIGFLIFTYLIIWIADNIQKSKDVNDLATVVRTYTIPLTEVKLKNLINRSFKQKYNLSDNVRASIFLPIRVGFFQWRLQMVCKTENIRDKELDALFSFNEGVLGYTFLKAKNYHVEFLDVSDPQNLPSTYVPLSQDNVSLIEQNLKAVTVLAFSQGKSITGLLAIDTTDNSDLQALQNRGLHSEAVNWMRSRKQDIEYLWRMMNNV